jgi:hypothetical protein
MKSNFAFPMDSAALGGKAIATGSHPYPKLPNRLRPAVDSCSAGLAKGSN